MGNERASLSDASARTGLSRYAYQGRHRTPDTPGTAVRNAALGAGAVAAIMVGTAAPASAAPDPWQQLRQCESGGNYSINTGNGYYGAYQFNIGTWRAYGGSGLPSDASPAEQDRIARKLYQARGWSPWPACSRKLGLRNDPSYGAAKKVTRPVTIAAPDELARGRTMVMTGTANAGATVRVYLRYAAESRYRLIRTVRANADGEWAVRVAPRGTGQFYAVSGARRTARIATRVVVPTTISAPDTVRVGAAYTVRGTARANTKVVVRLGRDGGSAQARTVRVNKAGRWSLVWKGSTDYRFYAVGETRSAVVATRVRTTTSAKLPSTTRLAAAPVRPVVTVTGTARPRTAVVLYVRMPNRSYRAFTKVVASDSGIYTTRFRAPADSFTWYARGSNGPFGVIG